MPTVRDHLALGLHRLRPAAPVVLIAGLLAFVPTSTCVVRLVLGVPSPACGHTRAGLAAARLDLDAAQHHHPLAIALVALTAGMVLFAFVARDAAWRRAVTITTGASGVALVVVWALRFAGLFGGPVPR